MDARPFDIRIDLGSYHHTHGYSYYEAL